MVNLEERKKRIDIANKFIQIISEHGRKFFYHKGNISRFKLGEYSSKVWYVDGYKNAEMCMSYAYWGKHNFSEGGTLKSLVKALYEYIMCRANLPINHLGPWPEWICRGDLWGYGFEEMEKVRAKCKALIADKAIEEANKQKEKEGKKNE